MKHLGQMERLAKACAKVDQESGIGSRSYFKVYPNYEALCQEIYAKHGVIVSDNMVYRIIMKGDTIKDNAKQILIQKVFSEKMKEFYLSMLKLAVDNNIITEGDIKNCM